MTGDQKPFFSIIVPVYNRGGLVGTTIQSVLTQTHGDFELIIVDDGSTDDTEDRVRAFQDSRLIYTKINNSERGFARNTGAKLSNGSYLNFFDSDDQMFSHHLQTAFDFIGKNKFPLWFHVGYEICDESGKVLITETGTDSAEKRLIKTNYLGCDSVFIAREFFMKHQFNEDRRLASSEDWELWLRIISDRPLLACKEVVVRMIQHDNRSLVTISPDRVIERDTLLLESLLNNRSFCKKFRRELPLFEADRYTFFALSLIVAKRKQEAFRYLWKSLVTTPSVMSRKRFWACLKLIIIRWL